MTVATGVRARAADHSNGIQNLIQALRGVTEAEMSMGKRRCLYRDACRELLRCAGKLNSAGRWEKLSRSPALTKMRRTAHVYSVYYILLAMVILRIKYK